MASSPKQTKSAKRMNGLTDSVNSMRQLVKYASSTGNTSRMLASAKSFVSTGGVPAEKEDRIQLNNDAAKAILKKLNGTVVDLEENFQKGGIKRQAMLKAAKETSRDEEVLKVQWQSVVEQAKTDMRKEHSVASRQDKAATYMNVMRELRLANRNPVLDYLLVHFTQPDEDALCHGAIENLLRWFDSATKLVVGTIDAPKHVDGNAGLQQLADNDDGDDKGFDPRAEAIAEWREMSQLVYKIGREQEAFTEISANMMKRTVDGVQRMDPEGVKKAKAAMHRMFTCFQQAVKEMLTVNDVLEDEDEMNRMIEEWDKILANDIGDKKKLEQLETAVVTLEDELQTSQMKLHRLQREVEQSAHEAEKRQHEMETMYEVISDERDRVMLSNEALKNEIDDLQNKLDTALMKANYVDALNRDKERLTVLKDQLERKVADMETDMVDYKAATEQQQKEFKELMKEIKIARDAKEAQIQLEAEHIELKATHQTALAKIEELQNNVARVEANAELNTQEAVKKAQDEADAAATAEKGKSQQLSFDFQDSQAKNKALRQKLKAAEEALAKAGQNVSAPAEPPEPLEPQVIGVTEDSTVEEVLDVLRGFQESALRSPFSRTEFVEGLDGFMSEALRNDMVEQLRKAHPGIFSAVPPLDLPDPNAEAADTTAEEADSKQVSCRDDNSVIESHRTAQDDAKDQEMHAAARPPTVDAMVNTDVATLAEAECQTDSAVELAIADDNIQTDDIQPENKTVDEVDDGEGNNGEGKVDESVDACWLGIVAESETSAVEQMMAAELATTVVANELTVVADLTVQLETVKTEREAARMESQLLNEKLVAAQQLADSAAGKLAEVEAMLQTSGTESAGSELARLQLQKQFDEQTQLRQQREDEISAGSVSELVTRVEMNELQEERDQLQSERDQLQSERDQLQSETNQLQTVRDDMQSSQDLLQTKHDKLLVDNGKLQADSAEIRDRVNELEELVHELMNDSSDVEEKSKAALEAIKAQADSKLNTERSTLEAEMVELKQTLQAVETEKAELQEKIAQLQGQLVSVSESSSGESQHLQRELMARSTELADAKSQAKQVEDILQAREEEQNDMQEQHKIVLDSAEQRYQELEKSYQQLESSSKQLQVTLNENRSELNAARKELIQWQDATEEPQQVQARRAMVLDAETGIDSDIEIEEKPVVVETMMQTEGPEYLQTDMQTEGQFVSVEDVHRVVSVCLADAEAQLARLEAKLKGVDLLEKRLDDLWNVSAVEGAALSKAVEQIEDKSLGLIQSVDGMQRDFSGVLALFPPMDVTVGETDAARVIPWNADSSNAAQKGSTGFLPNIHQRSNPAAIEQDVSCGGMLPVFNGGNVSETKDKLDRSVELLTEVANDIKQPEMKKKMDELIRAYSQIQQQIESSTAAGEPSTKDQLEQIEIGTQQANIKFAKLMCSKGFQETVKDKIAEWQGEISLSAGISNDMQLRYENARRKSLAKMAAKLIQNQKKAEMLYASVSHASPLDARFAGGGHAAPESWADTMGLYHGSETPKMQSEAGYQGRQRFYSVNIGGDGLADDWSRSRAPTAPKGGKPNPNQAVEDSSEFLFGWKANTESPPLTDRTRHSTHADHQGMDLKLPPLVKHAPARSKPKSRDKKQPVYEVKLRKAPKLGMLGSGMA